ncbi:hypothetical protein DL771_007336 [Monosporascus sp. 5C6A]|nr:hypothetical protein DL771_007336 [Monosporascus sp. 5C6A]
MAEQCSTEKQADSPLSLPPHAPATAPGDDIDRYDWQVHHDNLRQSAQRQQGGDSGGDPLPDDSDSDKRDGSQMYHDYLQQSARELKEGGDRPPGEPSDRQATRWYHHMLDRMADDLRVSDLDRPRGALTPSSRRNLRRGGGSGSVQQQTQLDKTKQAKRNGDANAPSLQQPTYSPRRNSEAKKATAKQAHDAVRCQDPQEANTKKKRDVTPPRPFNPHTYQPSGAAARMLWSTHQQQNNGEREQARQRLAEGEAREQQQQGGGGSGSG